MTVLFTVFLTSLAGYGLARFPVPFKEPLFMPAAVPAIITVALFAFIMSWNEFLGALVMMNTDAKFTLPLILSAARTETSLGGTDWGMLQAGVMISIVPCVLIYLLLQRYFIAGFLSGAVK